MEVCTMATTRREFLLTTGALALVACGGTSSGPDGGGSPDTGGGGTDTGGGGFDSGGSPDTAVGMDSAMPPTDVPGGRDTVVNPPDRMTTTCRSTSVVIAMNHRAPNQHQLVVSAADVAM